MPCAPPASDSFAPRRLAGLGQCNGDQSLDRNRGYHPGLVRRYRSVPARPPTDNASCRLGGNLAVLRTASVRTNVLGAWRGMEFLRGVASWKLSLRPAGNSALVHSKYRSAPYPPSV